MHPNVVDERDQNKINLTPTASPGELRGVMQDKGRPKLLANICRVLLILPDKPAHSLYFFYISLRGDIDRLYGLCYTLSKGMNR